MIKGDIRKQQILDTAERFFTSKGFEATSVQDILDEMNLSKGSFYHHYATKEEVLRRICENRAEQTAPKPDATDDAFPQDGLTRMNLFLHEMIPFHGEGMVFMKMVYPVFSNPVGKSVREGYVDALKKAWRPHIERALTDMVKEGSGYTSYPETTASIVMDLVNDLWQQLGDEIIGSIRDLDRQASPAKLLEMIEPYRHALENVMCAPYGSIVLLDLQDLISAAETIQKWDKT